MKKISFLFLLLLPAAVGMTFSSCNKYDDGPAVSLRTKKHRLVNSWRIDQVFETPQNGSKTDETTSYKNYYVNYLLTLDKEEKYTISYRPANIGDYNETGSWNFSAGKTNVMFANSNGNSSSIGTVWAILRLKENELWMETRNNSNTVIEAHFLPN